MGERSFVHFGIRTCRYEEMLRWYLTVLDARVLFRNAAAAFVSFDEEHHRLVIWTDSATAERPAGTAGIDHICVGLSGYAALAATYERLQAAGITPVLPVNHRFTTSLYYNDPDGNELEFSVDNFTTKEEACEFVSGPEMASIVIPPFGYVFNPELLVAMVNRGATREEFAALGQP